MSLRIGHGLDAHRLVDGRPLMLGGIRVEHERGLAGHSDGDAVVHALCDALLGAAGLGDMGAARGHLTAARIDCRAMTLRLHDTLTRARRAVEPLEDGHVRIYTCGPTVYARQH